MTGGLIFTLVKEHLEEDGVMVVNMNMRGSEEGNINQYLADTISNVFSEVYTVDVAGSTNRELFASNNADMMNWSGGEVQYYRGIYEEGGIKALLEQL